MTRVDPRHATGRRERALAGSAVVMSFGATLLSPVDWIPPLGYGGLVGIPVILFAALTITPGPDRPAGRPVLLAGAATPWSTWRPAARWPRRLRRVVGLSQGGPAAVVVLFVLWPPCRPSSSVGATPLTADPVALSPDTDARAERRRSPGSGGASALFPTVAVGALALADGQPRRARDPAGGAGQSALADVAGAPAARVSLTRPAGSATPTEPRPPPRPTSPATSWRTPGPAGRRRQSARTRSRRRPGTPSSGVGRIVDRADAHAARGWRHRGRRASTTQSLRRASG